jgi:hypothetical protein
VEISETIDGETNIIYTYDDSGKFTVQSGELILVVLRNPNGVTGTVKPTFYCDSWNYAAYFFFSLGTATFVYCFFKSRGDMETLYCLVSFIS